MKLFGTDGVRGKAGGFLGVDLALKLAMAAGIYFRKNAKTHKILIGKDTRRSGYMIENAIVAGLTAVGYDCIQIGPMPTPAVAFLTEDMRCDAGIMISASHNPYEDNGIKFFGGDGNKLAPEDEKGIEKIFFDHNFWDEHQQSGMAIGSSKRIDDVIGRYIVHIKNSFPKHQTLSNKRIVLDCANGAAYKVAPTIFRELGAELIVLNDSPTGNNINHDCGAMHPEGLAQAVRQYRADIGFALDGDADRLVVVDEKGEIIHGDILLGALGVYLSSHKELANNALVATIMSNGAMEEYLASHEIALRRCLVGDKYVLETMLKEDLNFGGEQSGHIIFGDYAKTGDGTLSALQVMACLITSGKPASEALRPFSLYPEAQGAIKVKEKKPLESLEGLTQKLEAIEALGMRHLVRYSGTENKLRVLIEGKEEKRVWREFDELMAFLEDKLNA